MAIARLGVAGHQLEEVVVDLLDHLAEEVAGHQPEVEVVGHLLDHL